LAKASRFDWQRLDCRAEGRLDRVDRATHFTEFTLHATLTLSAGADQQRARKHLEITLLEITLVAD